MQLNVRVAPFMCTESRVLLAWSIVAVAVAVDFVGISSNACMLLSIWPIDNSISGSSGGGNQSHADSKPVSQTLYGINVAVAFHAFCAYCIMSPHKPGIVWCITLYTHTHIHTTYHHSRCLLLFTTFSICGTFIAAVMCYFYYCGTLISKPIIEIKQI